MSEPDDVLCALMLRWLRRRVAEAGQTLDVVGWTVGTPPAVWALTDRALEGVHDDGGSVAALEALAAEEARLRLEAAREALLDAATEVASLTDADGCIALVDLAAHELAMATIYRANEEWQEAQLQAYAPHEAEGLVDVARAGRRRS